MKDRDIYILFLELIREMIIRDCDSASARIDFNEMQEYIFEISVKRKKPPKLRLVKRDDTD